MSSGQHHVSGLMCPELHMRTTCELHCLQPSWCKAARGAGTASDGCSSRLESSNQSRLSGYQLQGADQPHTAPRSTEAEAAAEKELTLSKKVAP